MAVVFTVQTLSEAEGLEEEVAALAGAPWRVRVPRLHRLDSAPSVLRLLEDALLKPAVRQGCGVTPIETLGAAAHLSSLLRDVNKLIRGHIARRKRYETLQWLGEDVCAMALFFPAADRAIFTDLGNRIPHVAARGMAKAAIPVSRTRRHLISLFQTVRQHQSGMVVLAVPGTED